MEIRISCKGSGFSIQKFKAIYHGEELSLQKKHKQSSFLNKGKKKVARFQEELSREIQELNLTDPSVNNNKKTLFMEGDVGQRVRATGGE